MAISGVANSDVENGAKYLGMARTGSGTKTSVAGIMNGFAYKAKTATSSDQTGKVLRLTIANHEGLCIVDWGDGTTTQVAASAGSTIDHTYATTGSKSWDITSSGFHKAGTQTLA